MQIIIEMSEETYRTIRDDNYTNVESYCGMLAIRNGTPLPKGHGRLGDLDAVMNDIYASVNEMTNIGIMVDGEYLWSKLKDAIENAPIIIEADNAESEDKCSNCAKSWTDECPRDKCWDNNYSKFIEESEESEVKE